MTSGPCTVELSFRICLLRITLIILVRPLMTPISIPEQFKVNVVTLTQTWTNLALKRLRDDGGARRRSEGDSNGKVSKDTTISSASTTPELLCRRQKAMSTSCTRRRCSN